MNRSQTDSMFIEELKALVNQESSIPNKLFNSIKSYYNNKSLSLELSIGDEVDHIKFGRGTVMSKDHACARIQFGSKERKISLDYAQKVLKKADGE